MAAATTAVLGLLCVEQNVAGSNLTLRFDFFHLSNFFLSSHRISVHNNIHSGLTQARPKLHFQASFMHPPVQLLSITGTQLARDATDQSGW